MSIDTTDLVALEEPLEIRLGDVPIAVLMRTPGDDPDLIRGFAVTEAIVLGPHELGEPVDLGEGRWELVLAAGVVIDPEQFRRNLYSSSSCGVCGKASIDAVLIAAADLPPGPIVPVEVLNRLSAVMRDHQAGFDATGSLHAAALFNAAGELLTIREDIGRHNAVDKVVGAAMTERLDLAASILFVSGRVSFEISQKAAVAGIPVVCGVSAASSLAIDLAARVGLTLAGFVREGSLVVYTRPDRVG
ncbi:MAG: formate dehydrogenase accessory sulfurtransferase FdhD [Acidimicrobiia bacterium]|nr:formate dehydrogenase accessory sulfurtransferase FdhD [Acidimicrobiia bacterium]MDH5505517.1 formate dehydrogenase accessory sulfurtransferase FdhD [Acidimicrobiia bacterium]